MSAAQASLFDAPATRGSSRFVIHWSRSYEDWHVRDTWDDANVVAFFPTLLEAETYVIERQERTER